MGQNFSDRGLKKSIDWKLVITYLLLILIGWVNIYASIHSDGPSSIFDFGFRCGKQFVWILTALGLAALILFVCPARLWESASFPLYLITLVLLVAVIFLGVEVKGSRSWFEFGPVRFQPAEVSKITTSLLLATVMSQSGFRIDRFRDLMLTALVIGVPMLVILGESETGSALVYAGFIFVMYREGFSGWWIAAIGIAILMFVLTLTASPYTAMMVLIGILIACNALNNHRRFNVIIAVNILVFVLLALLPWALGQIGTEESFIRRIKPLYVLIGICVCAVPVFLAKGFRERNRFISLSAISVLAGIALVFSVDYIFNDILKDHQRKRIEVLLGMKEDPSGVGYNVNQSMIAIGSGGLTGKGFLNGTQTTFGFVPEQSTDFIFCTVGEEWGFLGCLVVIALYVFLIWRLIYDAEQCREAFTRIFGYCVAACIFMHLFINVGMTIGLMPVIGIPLPLLSYGGSSLWTFTVMIFIFIALYRQEKSTIRMRKIVLGIALLGMLAGACGRVSESKKTEEEPFTELLGELEPGSLGDSVMVYIGNGEDDTVATYPILDDMFAVILKTDRMKAGSIMIKYDEGISSGFFIPEGGKIRIRMDREGRVRIDHESKKSSLTKEYVTLSEESDRLYYGLIRQRDSVAKAEGLTGEKYDSLDASYEKVFNERTMEQSLEVLKKHPDDVLGVLAIKNMLSAGGASKAREMIGCLSEEARNHPSLPDSLKF